MVRRKPMSSAMPSFAPADRSGDNMLISPLLQRLVVRNARFVVKLAAVSRFAAVDPGLANDRNESLFFALAVGRRPTPGAAPPESYEAAPRADAYSVDAQRARSRCMSMRWVTRRAACLPGRARSRS